MGAKVSIVIPVYKAEKSIELLVKGIVAEMQRLDRDFEIILVDDCSPDGSWEILKKLKSEYEKKVKITRLAVNSGQHNALLCGFSLVTGEVVVTMDDDLQNPPSEIEKLISAIDRGYDLAIGAYESKQHSRLRNRSGQFIDQIIRHIFHLPRHFQLTSFRAIKRVVVNNVLQMGGVFPYITCMLFVHTHKYINIPVRHDPRPFGQSNYTMKKSLKLAANLIFSYSSYPLYFVAGLCSAAFVFAISFGTVVIFRALIHGISVPGWASTVIIVSFFNALILLCLLIFGIYIARMNQQVTHSRVKYTISELYE